MSLTIMYITEHLNMKSVDRFDRLLLLIPKGATQLKNWFNQEKKPLLCRVLSTSFVFVVWQKGHAGYKHCAIPQ